MGAGGGEGRKGGTGRFSWKAGQQVALRYSHSMQTPAGGFTEIGGIDRGLGMLELLEMVVAAARGPLAAAVCGG